MSEEEKKIIVDDDWKAEAKREKEKLAEKEGENRLQAVPAPAFAEVVNIVVMQAMAALGLLAGPGGERMPPDPAAAKHFIDLLQVLDDKTKGNLTPDEKRMLDQVLYEVRMAFVQVTSGAPGGATPPPPTSPPPGTA
jgi:hypothetical protein